MLRCVIFDLDNTLVNSPLDFAKIKAEIGSDDTILEYRATVAPDEQKRIDDILARHEGEAAENSDMLDGAHDLLEHLAAHGVKTALLTRNSRKSIDTITRRHKLNFDFLVSRDDSEPKPSPAPVFLICEKLGVKPEESLIVGDYLFDIQSGQAAGTRTMLIDGPHRHRFEIDADFEVASLHEALEIITSLLNETEG